MFGFVTWNRKIVLNSKGMKSVNVSVLHGAKSAIIQYGMSLNSAKTLMKFNFPLQIVFAYECHMEIQL